MAKVELQIKGREALQKRLNEKRQYVINTLNTRLAQLAEEAVTYSKNNKGYKDRTANLKNSISFALYFDGELLTSKVSEDYNPTYKDEKGKCMIIHFLWIMLCNFVEMHSTSMHRKKV